MSNMTSASLSVLRSAFREYYFRRFDESDLPDKFDQREFGFSRLGEDGMQRHVAFESPGELHAYLVKQVPSDVYCSNAWYRNPTLPMQEKEWLGASLIFDIDGKDLRLPCVGTHSFVRCHRCGKTSLLSEDQSIAGCPSCKEPIAKNNLVSLPCAKCINGSRTHAMRLTQFLTHDFGISADQILIYFSGNNGFHVHVNKSGLEHLDSRARLEIVSYVTAKGLIPETIGVRKANDAQRDFTVRVPRELIQFGWSKRLADDLKIDMKSSDSVYSKIKSMGGYEGLKERISSAAAKNAALIDPQVTSDVHRIFRLPNTINSKSSLAKVKCTNIADFDAFRDACVLGEQKISIRLSAPVKVALKGKTFKVSKEVAELPAFAAAYLICKGIAQADESIAS